MTVAPPRSSVTLIARVPSALASKAASTVSPASTATLPWTAGSFEPSTSASGATALRPAPSTTP